ncbi:MAG TPA: phage tail sheath subtilisin-like domain-containing protein [Solirubrobacteraceae bacterium]
MIEELPAAGAPIAGVPTAVVAAWVASDAGPPRSRFSTLYWPWITVADPLAGAAIAVPPCGHVAGVWARTDRERGVFKAPANEELRGALGLGYDTSDAEQASLNDAGLNCIRSFPGRGILVWGARTLALEAEPESRYVNLRRLLTYISASILEGTQWAVFEPNDWILWKRLQASVSDFLTVVWRSGALLGASPREAFFVRCDATTTTDEDVDLGRVNILVGVALAQPGEFVTFLISQYQPAG